MLKACSISRPKRSCASVSSQVGRLRAYITEISLLYRYIQLLSRRYSWYFQVSPETRQGSTTRLNVSILPRTIYVYRRQTQILCPVNSQGTRVGLQQRPKDIDPELLGYLRFMQLPSFLKGLQALRPLTAPPKTLPFSPLASRSTDNARRHPLNLAGIR